LTVLRTCTRPLSCAFVERRLGPERGSIPQNGSQLQPRFRAAGKYTGKYLYSRMNRLAVNQPYQQHITWPCPYHCRNFPERQDLGLLVAGGTCSRPATSSQRSVGTTKYMSVLQKIGLGDSMGRYRCAQTRPSVNPLRMIPVN
jgi:hypothetical protein